MEKAKQLRSLGLGKPSLFMQMLFYFNLTNAQLGAVILRQRPGEKGLWCLDVGFWLTNEATFPAHLLCWVWVLRDRSQAPHLLRREAVTHGESEKAFTQRTILNFYNSILGI